MTEDGLNRAIRTMRAAGQDETAVAVFAHYYALAASGATGLIPEDSISPLTDVPRLSGLHVEQSQARDALAQTAIIKLNGGLGTSMGLNRAKTLLPVRDGRTFLDLIVEQVRYARARHQVRLPLLFMNSFRTRVDTLAHLQRYPDLAVDGLPLDFLQSAEPKIRADDLTPVQWAADPSLEWCPPGHGEVYTRLASSGLLAALLDRGYRYVSIANGDNLGAAPDPTLAGWFAASGAPYAAEVCVRTANDRKGGHLAVRRSDGQLILRDTAQTPADEMPYFTDEHRHRFFHCNNLWIDLIALQGRLEASGPVLGLPLIRNEKTVDPTDPASPRVLQLETAMGAAIEVFPGARAIAVERDRFLPVKTTNELMLLRSDVFSLGVDGRLSATVAGLPEVDLDPRFYKTIDQFDQRVPIAPSLKDATALRVRGDWTFDRPTRVVGEGTLDDPGNPEHSPPVVPEPGHGGTDGA